MHNNIILWVNRVGFRRILGERPNQDISGEVQYTFRNKGSSGVFHQHI
jgi:hypothetical protein